MEVKVTKDNFAAEVEKSDVPVIVDFWATWCPPCKMLSPILKQIDEEKNGAVKICKVNIDEEEELAVKFDVTSIPTMLFYKDGQIINKAVGLQPKEDIERLLT